MLGTNTRVERKNGEKWEQRQSSAGSSYYGGFGPHIQMFREMKGGDGPEGSVAPTKWVHSVQSPHLPFRASFVSNPMLVIRLRLSFLVCKNTTHLSKSVFLSSLLCKLSSWMKSRREGGLHFSPAHLRHAFWLSLLLLRSYLSVQLPFISLRLLRSKVNVGQWGCSAGACCQAKGFECRHWDPYEGESHFYKLSSYLHMCMMTHKHPHTYAYVHKIIINM